MRTSGGEGPRLRWLLLFAALFALLFAAVAIAVGMGSAEIPPGVAVVVDHARGGTITTDEVDQALKQQASFAGLERAPGPANPRYREIREGAVNALMTAVWLENRGETMGIRISAAQIEARLAKKGERGHLEEAQFTPATMREYARTQLLVEAIEAALEEAGLSELEQQDRFREFDSGLIDEWQPRTHCAAGYQVPRCANYVVGHPIAAPAACYEADPKEADVECPAPVLSMSPALPGTVTPAKPEGKRLAQRPNPG